MTACNLVCTVGGSHQPIVTALRELAPAYVVFICSGRDPATGRPGSDVQITGNGSIIRAHPSDPSPSLPNIPTQVGLTTDQFEVVYSPTDDLDGATGSITNAIKVLQSRFPDVPIIADYTGGTKTMTAALVLAAVEYSSVQLRLVTGIRGNLVKVADGTQGSVIASTEGVRVRREIQKSLAMWQQFAYRSAEQVLRNCAFPNDASVRGQLSLVRDLSWAFDAWDRFDHSSALQRLIEYRPRVGESLSLHFKFLSLLTDERPESAALREVCRLWDLWLNAERRAVQGRFDDAVARVYRFMEWVAQWILRSELDIDTSSIPIDKVPPTVQLQKNDAGTYVAGLVAAWELIAHLGSNTTVAFAQEEKNRIVNYTRARNASILAHGFTPVTEEMWEDLSEWMTGSFLPMFGAKAQAAGLRFVPHQLPTELVGIIK